MNFETSRTSLLRLCSHVICVPPPLYVQMEAKYEEENEAVQKEISSKQNDLTTKIKIAEENLAQMTQQQTDMMEQTKNEVGFVFS